MFFRRPINEGLKKSIIIFCALLPFVAFSQNNIPTGSWRTHYSFNSTISITQSAQDVYAASTSGLYIVSKKDNSLSSITTLNGLSETGITQIHYNHTSETLLITYENGQIDLLKDNLMSSIPDIKLSDIFKSKITYHMNEDGIFTYLSTDFGLIKIDTETQIIRESFLNLSSTGDNLKIYASTIYNDSIFLASENGIMAGSLSENLKDFTKWKRFDLNDGITQENNKVIALYEGNPISANSSQGILLYQNGNWIAIGELVGADFSDIVTSNTTLIISSGNVYKLNNSGLQVISSVDIIKANSAISDGTDNWVADNQNGLVHINDSFSESIYPNGPFFNEIIHLKTVSNKVFALPQFKSSNGLPIRNIAGYSVFENGIWSNYNSTGYPNTKMIPEFLDISGVSKLSSGEIIFSSYGYGLLSWNEEIFELIDDINSPLINSLPPNKNILIAGVAADNNNLWVLNNNTNSSLHSFNNDKTWTTFTPSISVSSADQIISTPWGDQWIAIDPTSGGGIIVHNQMREEIVLKKSGIGTIPSNTINQIALDKEDKIWIATDKGVVYYLFPYSLISDPNQEAIVPIIDSRLLFNNEKVNALAVDGGNRIWMGTNKGAWLFDNDGSVLITHFTSENSPLLSDVVTNISINNLTGEVFFNTAMGLISYRGTATVTGTYANPKIFPNPVNPGYSGVITIEGVPTNSDLKITDASGRLVANIEAIGNTAVWDMNNEHLSPVVSGVYFVFISNDDGSSTQFGKIAIIK